MKKPLFGTSGVRGVVNQDLTPDLCKNVARALGTVLVPGSSVCVATDSRLSRDLIKHSVAEGLTETGINVADLEILPTPALALLTREMGFNAGIMITASHNPPEYNGIKLFNASSIGYDASQEQEIETVYYGGKFRTGDSGKLEKMPGLQRKYYDFVKKYSERMSFNRQLKIMIDPGNGAASGFASELYRELGFNVIPVNDTPDGRFPGRSPEPKEDTLKGTITFMRQKNADLAICFDGDADRVVFCDQQGFLGFNEVLSFISRQAIQSTGKKIVATTVETGILLDLAVKDIGGKVVRGKVGDVHVAYLAREHDAALGVESVGVYVFPAAGYYPDTIIAALTLLGSINDVKEIRDFIKSLPPLRFDKDKVPCPDEFKAAVMDIVKQKAASLEAESINDLDGLRFEFSNAWMLIRASGTEPAVRVLAEAKTAHITEDLLTKGINLVKKAIKEANP